MFDTYQDKAEEWRWRLKAPNGEVLAIPEEGFSSKSACERSIEKVAMYATLSGVLPTTEEQIRDASRRALFIWRKLDTTFPDFVAEYLDRRDIDIMPVDWLDRKQDWTKVKYSEVIVDSHAVLTKRQQKAVRQIRS